MSRYFKLSRAVCQTCAGRTHGSLRLGLRRPAELAIAHDFAIEQHALATRRAYRSEFALFAAWCATRGLSACPAAAEAICAFVADEVRNGTKVATITRRIVAIRYAHALKGIDPLPTTSEAVKATMKGIRRTAGAAPTRKAPATHGIIADMIANCPDTLRGTRDRALLLVGFAGAFRRSELAALTVADLEPTEAGLLTGSVSTPSSSVPIRFALASSFRLPSPGRACSRS